MNNIEFLGNKQQITSDWKQYTHGNLLLKKAQNERPAYAWECECGLEWNKYEHKLHQPALI